MAANLLVLHATALHVLYVACHECCTFPHDRLLGSTEVCFVAGSNERHVAWLLACLLCLQEILKSIVAGTTPYQQVIHWRLHCAAVSSCKTAMRLRASD